MASIRDGDEGDVGVAFSGGLDSTLLAKVCGDLGKHITLLTVCFESAKDIEVSREVAELIGFNLQYDLISLDELESGLKTVLDVIEFDRLVRLENCVCFYYVFRLASKHGLSEVLSANGMDELFCGYSSYKELFGHEDEMTDLMKTLVEVARKDKQEMDKLALLFGVRYLCPFLSDGFVEYAMNVPSELKINSREDNLRKHIVREVAIEIGVPAAAAMREKKAFQYSSGIHKAIRKLARTKGFTRPDANVAGFSSEAKAYICSLGYKIPRQANPFFVP